jgi:hypothetical protein
MDFWGTSNKDAEYLPELSIVDCLFIALFLLAED